MINLDCDQQLIAMSKENDALMEANRLTALEREVVEAAVAYREAQSQVWIQNEVGTEYQAKIAKATERETAIKLLMVTENLVLARKKAQVETN